MSAQMSKWPVIAGANWWEPTTGSFTCVAAYQPKGAASLAASYVNLANPGTYDAAPGAAPTLDADGWVFVNLSALYLTTGITAGQGWTAIARFSHGTFNAPGDYRIVLGTDSSTDRRFYLWPVFSATQAVFGGGGFVIYDNGSLLSAGVMAIAGREGYLNGAWVAQTNAAYSGDAHWPLLIGAAASAADGSSSLWWDGKIQAIAIYSTTLDATQIAEVTDAMEAI